MKNASIIPFVLIPIQLLHYTMTFSQQTRTEKDLLGNKEINANAYYGVQTARALENFTISGITTAFYPDYVKAFAMVKLAAARATCSGRATEQRKIIGH